MIKIFGYKMNLDPKDSVISKQLEKHGIYERLETQLIRKELKKGDTFIDIGAHIGYYTLLAASIVGESGKVFVFEPDCNNFNILKQNVEINNLSNIVLSNYAILNTNKKLKLYLSKTNTGDHRVYDSFDGRESIDIESIFLDEFFMDYSGKINFIKIDIQGAEIKALQGMDEIIKKHEPRLMIELWPFGLKKYGHNPIELLDILKSHNYEINIIHRIKNSINNYSPIPKNYVIPRERHMNLFCYKKG